MTFAEQIAALVETRKEKAARMKEVAQKSAEESRSMDDAEAQEFDTLRAEIKRLDDDIARLKHLEDLERQDAATAQPVDGQADEAARQPVNTKGIIHARPRNTQKQAPGLGFARFARVKLLAKVEREPVEVVAKSLYPNDDKLVSIVKAPVPAANTNDPAWAGDLINDASVFADFVEFLRPMTLLGQIQDRLRQLPFDTPVLVQNSGGTAAWVQEGNAKPLTQWSYSKAKLVPLTVAAITAATKQQLMRASVAADMLFRDELARAVGATMDSTFADPGVAPVADESPGSIFNGVTGLTPNGDTGIIGVRCDIATMLNAHNDANLNFDGLFWVMSGRNAIALSQMTNEIGNLAYPTVTPTGGTLAGFPVMVSNFAPADFVALVKGSEIYYGDEGGLDVAMSEEASLVMEDASTVTGSSTTPTATQVVSMFQTNSVAFRVERFVNWQRRRNAAVAWMAAQWDACETAS